MNEYKPNVYDQEIIKTTGDGSRAGPDELAKRATCRGRSQTLSPGPLLTFYDTPQDRICLERAIVVLYYSSRISYLADVAHGRFFG